MSDVTMLGILGAGAAALVIYSLWPKRDEQAEAIRRRAMGLRADLVEQTDVRKQAKTAAHMALLQRAAPMLSRPMMPKNEKEQTSLRIKLSNAGYRNENASTLFLASKTIVGIGLAIAGVFLAMNTGKPTMTIFGYGAVGAGLGFFLPELWLHMARRARVQSIRNGLPDALDLMVVSVEAGLGLDASMQRVGDEMRHVHVELAEEMQIATIETQMGIHRADALQQMAIRAGVEEMKALVAVITQAEKLGTSIAKALRTQADALRTKRRQKAEERAQKTAVKLMLPLILFIFPAIMVVLGAPAGIKIYETMSGGGLTGGS